MILYCPYEKLVYPKIATNLFLEFCPEIFFSFFGASLGLNSNIMNKEAYRKPKKASRKPPGSYKKIRAEIQK